MNTIESEFDLLRGRKIIVVDDEVLIALQIATILEESGVIVAGPYYSLEGILSVVEDIEVDVAILDINLNGSKIFTAADILQRRNVPIIFHSGNSDAAHAAERYPGCLVLRKPCADREILQAAADHISAVSLTNA